MTLRSVLRATAAFAIGLSLASAVQASSHREAPFITTQPKVDGTDFYMFRSYESGRGGFVTLIANYQGLQDSYGGPNYFAMDPDALYEIHIDNTGDSVEDLTFQFRFTNTYKGFAVNGNTSGSGAPVDNAIPLINLPPSDSVTPTLNLVQTYAVKLVRGGRRTGNGSAVKAQPGGSATFTKPVDNIGTMSIPDYQSYANQFIYSIDIPGCNTAGRMFVGQRREGFVVNLGQVFDLVNLNPLGARNSAATSEHPTGSIIDDKNVTSLALELPISCVTAKNDPVIGGWTTASKRQGRLLNPNPTGPGESSAGRGPALEGGAWTQVSRLGSPLVNEVVIGITDKDKFNASQPKNDVANFGAYVLYPTLPVLINALFSVPPPSSPRSDLLAAFVTGITTGPNDTPANFKFTAPARLTVPGEMLRLNTAIGTVVPGTGSYSDLGFLGCDLAGFPNGRRVTDDVVDIELTVAEGALVGANGLQTCDLSGPSPAVKNPGAVVNDGARPDPGEYLTVFPYLNTPLPGAK
jgi:hypothetical protein